MCVSSSSSSLSLPLGQNRAEANSPCHALNVKDVKERNRVRGPGGSPAAGMMVRDVSQRRVSSSSIKEPNVIYFNIRSVITLVAGITALIIFTVVLFNVVAARFAYPPADSEPQPSPPSTTATANTPSTASSSTRNTLPPAAAPVLPAAAKLRKDFSEKGSHKKHQKGNEAAPHYRRPPRHNEYPDENDASEPMQADAPMRQDSPDSALVDNYETWRDIMPEDSGPERRPAVANVCCRSAGG
ncbi:hypothetical protein HPB48_020374 [Haemaphysalis longicornis]|uniref:Uncharacterized protein n=1 Tax=Haemaphysalis longicornis TaxID=44386 RepID=A0A9J6GYT8_HAELO|nr:hypothetical protein HPB48_020374 [Haemaphysalis longicornis]